MLPLLILKYISSNFALVLLVRQIIHFKEKRKYLPQALPDDAGWGLCYVTPYCRTLQILNAKLCFMACFTCQHYCYQAICTILQIYLIWNNEKYEKNVTFLFGFIFLVSKGTEKIVLFELWWNDWEQIFWQFQLRLQDKIDIAFVFSFV